jgi:hypothetical protein
MRYAAIRTHRILGTNSDGSVIPTAVSASDGSEDRSSAKESHADGSFLRATEGVLQTEDWSPSNRAPLMSLRIRAP